MENKIAIHGLGYVGLTAAVHWAKAGWTVYAYDHDLRVIQALREGTPRASEFLAYLNADVAQLVADGKILPTRTFVATLECNVHSIAIPTEKDGKPWEEGVLALLHELVFSLNDANTILVESTLTPGTIDRLLMSIDGAGRDRNTLPDIAVCPRRDWFADASKSLETLDRIVGGVTPRATEVAAELISTVTKGTIHRCGYREAEFTKALENAWLHALVMLPTELMINRSDIDIARVMELASTHWRLPTVFGGAGCGGRCVPIATKYLLDASGPGGILEAVNTTERHIRVHVAEAIARRVRDHRFKRVLVLGVAYRPNFRDAGLSPGLDVARYLRNDFGIETLVHDPMWTREELANLTGFEVSDPMSLGYGAVFLATPHAEYASLPGELDWRSKPFVMDAHGGWSRFETFFEQSGIEYTRVGSAGWR